MLGLHQHAPLSSGSQLGWVNKRHECEIREGRRVGSSTNGFCSPWRDHPSTDSHNSFFFLILSKILTFLLE